MKTILLTAILLGAAGLNAAADTFSLAPSSATPTSGSQFTIDLIVTGNTDEIQGFGLDYNVSTNAILLQSVTINPFFGPDFGLGDPQISVFTFPGQTDPTVNLVSFSFLANSVGTSVFNVSSDVNDPSEGLFILNGPTLDLSSQVTIDVQPAAVPEPGSVGLLALVATWLMVAGVRRRDARRSPRS